MLSVKTHCVIQTFGLGTWIVVVGRNSVVCTATIYGWTGAGLFPGGNRLGRVVDHQPPASADVKERVELYLCSPSGRSWPVIG
jgi:hypothetical protein